MRMKSAGNDIVATDLINKQRSNEKRFYSKFLSSSEVELFHKSGFESTGISFESFVWLLWTVKESAYKFMKRDHPDLVFSPTRIVIQNINAPAGIQFPAIYKEEWEGSASDADCFKGSFIFENKTYFFKSIIHHDFITSIVSADQEFRFIHWGIRKIKHSDYLSQHSEVRTFILKKIKNILPGKNFTIEKSSLGFPVVLNGSHEMNIPVSFSHHGCFVGYSFFLGLHPVLSHPH